MHGMRQHGMGAWGVSTHAHTGKSRSEPNFVPTVAEEPTISGCIQFSDGPQVSSAGAAGSCPSRFSTLTRILAWVSGCLALAILLLGIFLTVRVRKGSPWWHGLPFVRLYTKPKEAEAVPSMIGALALVCWFVFLSWRLLGCPTPCKLIPAIQVLRWFILLLWMLTVLVFLGLACWSAAGHEEQAPGSEEGLPPPSAALPSGHAEIEPGQTSAGSLSVGSPEVPTQLRSEPRGYQRSPSPFGAERYTPLPGHEIWRV